MLLYHLELKNKARLCILILIAPVLLVSSMYVESQSLKWIQHTTPMWCSGEIFFLYKPNISQLEYIGFEYRIPCRNYDSTCIGETSRTGTIRIKEHNRVFNSLYWKQVIITNNNWKQIMCRNLTKLKYLHQTLLSTIQKCS